MKVAILTTDTIHHQYFIHELSKKEIELFVIYENLKNENNLTPNRKSYLEKVEKYELNHWGNFKKNNSSKKIQAYNFNDINCDESHDLLKRIHPHLIIVFGTRKLDEKIINIQKNNIFNLHGGNPEEYRGLDSHLWAIYHNDFKELITTIHRVSKTLDTGEIVLQGKIQITRNMELHQLRLHNTELCIELVECLIQKYIKDGRIFSRIQSRKGRYYSSIPDKLIPLITNKFKLFTSNVNFNA